MLALNFKPQFVDRILSGHKYTTIRKQRKHPIKVGDALYLYTGLRTKDCQKLADAVCVKTTQIKLIHRGSRGIFCSYPTDESRGYYTPIGYEDLYKSEGFDSSKDMEAFFARNPEGPYQLIEWKLLITEDSQ